MILHRDVVSGIVAAAFPGSAECDTPLGLVEVLDLRTEAEPVTLYRCPRCGLLIPCVGDVARNQYPESKARMIT